MSEGLEADAKSKLRHRWNHQSGVHRAVVRNANATLHRVPNKLLYETALKRRRHVLPYSLVGPGDTAIQVGAPADTLMSGRARSMSLGLLTTSGTTVAVEPSERSVRILRQAAQELGATSLEVVHAALFSDDAADSLVLYEDDDHPARNFVEGTVDYSEETLREFKRVEVPSSTLDKVWAETLDRQPVRLVSITTNGSEEAILAGGSEMLRHTAYLALAITSDDVVELAASHGFKLIDNDDRGYTFVADRNNS